MLIGPGRGSSPERDHAGILLLDSQASIELREIISVVYKPPRLWRFIMATLKDQGRLYIMSSFKHQRYYLHYILLFCNFFK